MARPTMLAFGKTPTPKAGQWYVVRVDLIGVRNASARAQLSHLEPELEGVTHTLERDMPLNPLGPFGSLVRACGLIPDEEAKIDHRGVSGKIIRAKFAPKQNGSMGVIAFASREEEVDHDSK